MSLILEFALGMIVGAGIVGSSVHRTLSVHKGSYLQAALSANANSVFYYFSIAFIAKENISAYLGTCVGSFLIVIYMTHRNRKLNKLVAQEKK